METKTTTASVRVMISHNYSNFEVSMNLENPEGIKIEEINKARQECQTLALHAVDEYKAKPPVDSKKEIARIEKELKQIKAITGESKELKSDNSPEAIAEVESLPLYNTVKKPKK